MKTQTKIKRAFRIVSDVENTDKIEAIEDLLREEGYEFQEDPFYPLARRCTQEVKPLGSSLAHYFGFIYIQDRSSMLPPIALDPPKDAIILDMCASPGSKTSMLSAMVEKEGAVIANEPNLIRLLNLKRNLEKMQCLNSVTCNYNAKHIPIADKTFDYILLDPPCSGWGTIDKNSQVRKVWTEEKVHTLVALQQDLLKEATRLLKFNGKLVYSTCTTNPKENDAQVRYACDVLGLELESLDVVPDFKMTEPANDDMNGVWRIEPRLRDTQGFFVAKFRRNSNVNNHSAPVEESQKKLAYEQVLIKEITGHKGKTFIFDKNVHYIPTRLLEIAFKNKNFQYQGMHIGKHTGVEALISPELRLFDSFKSFKESEDVFIFESKRDLQIIYALINGQSINYEGLSRTVPFYFKGLYLGNLTKKGNRLLWVTK